MQIQPLHLIFPAVETANKEGILAYGGDLSVERLLLAYQNGIFPWFNPEEPILWWAPPQRMVLFPKDFVPSKSLQKTIDKGIFKVTFNKHFETVIRSCAVTKRKGQHGTWISEEMVSAYVELHMLGFAKSVEVWKNNEIVGGLYGIDLGHVFCGESMFTKTSNASKVGFAWLVHYLNTNNYKLLDCQVHNQHLQSLGCIEIDRKRFMEILTGQILEN